MRRLAALLLLASGAAAADLLPAETPGLVPRDLVVATDRGERVGLRGALAGTPALLVPIFARCTGTCPLTAIALKNGLAQANAPFRVALLSFDDGDTAGDLRDFRERFALPPEWTLLRSTDPGATRAFFDEFGFHFMQANGTFDHPDETIVLSPNGAWAATFTGSAFHPADLESAVRRARDADAPTHRHRIAAWLTRPEAWIALACAGAAASLASIAAVIRGHHT